MVRGRSSCALLASTLLALFFGGKALAGQSANEWGYEPKPVEQKPLEMKAGEAGLLDGLKAKTKPSSLSKPAQPEKPLTATPGKLQSLQAQPPATPRAKSEAAKTPLKTGKPVKASPMAIEAWVELLDTVSEAPLADSQKARFKAQLTKDAASGQTDFNSAIMQFWPLVKKRIGADTEQKQAFSNLFRALLRFELKGKQLSEGDNDMLMEALGPERVARPGTPPLTEEAVDAYGDMACFLYELKHPGKSVDSYENRAMFTEVIYGKYRDAPTPSDKRAMCNFALTWSKFKVTWLAANESDRQELVQCMAASKPIPVALRDPLVESIFHNGPWSKIVLPKDKPAPKQEEAAEDDVPMREAPAAQEPPEQPQEAQ